MHGLEIFLLYGAIGLIVAGGIIHLLLQSRVSHSAFVVSISVFLFVLSMNDRELVDLLDFVPMAFGGGLIAFGLASIGAGFMSFVLGTIKKQIMKKADS